MIRPRSEEVFTFEFFIMSCFRTCCWNQKMSMIKLLCRKLLKWASPRFETVCLPSLLKLPKERVKSIGACIGYFWCNACLVCWVSRSSNLSFGSIVILFLNQFSQERNVLFPHLEIILIVIRWITTISLCLHLQTKLYSRESTKIFREQVAFWCRFGILTNYITCEITQKAVIWIYCKWNYWTSLIRHIDYLYSILWE